MSSHRPVMVKETVFTVIRARHITPAYQAVARETVSLLQSDTSALIVSEL